MTTSERDIRSEIHDLAKRYETEYGIHTYAPSSDSPLVRTIITEQLKHTCVEISWSNAHGGILLGFEREGSFAPLEAEFNEQQNGICIIQSRASEGFITRELKPSVYYCYHIFLKVKNKHYAPPHKTSPADLFKKFFTRLVTEDEYFNYEVAHFSRQLPAIDLQAELNKKLQVLRTLTDIASQEKVLAQMQKTAPEKSEAEKLKESKQREKNLKIIAAQESFATVFAYMKKRDETTEEVREMRRRGEIKTDEEMDKRIEMVEGQYDDLIRREIGI